MFFTGTLLRAPKIAVPHRWQLVRATLTHTWENCLGWVLLLFLCVLSFLFPYCIFTLFHHSLHHPFCFLLCFYLCPFFSKKTPNNSEIPPDLYSLSKCKSRSVRLFVYAQSHKGLGVQVCSWIEQPVSSSIHLLNYFTDYSAKSSNDISCDDFWVVLFHWRA